MNITLTGGSGTLGSHLAPAFAAAGHTVTILDKHPPSTLPTGCDYHNIDLRAPDATRNATHHTDVIIHTAAGITHTDAPLPAIYEHNLLPTYHVLEAAREHHTSRVVLASSHHTIGFTPTDQTITSTDTAPNPDSIYGVGKITDEALASLYAHKHHLDIAAIRIGSLRTTPTKARHAATWLSPRDAITLFTAAATKPLPHPFTLLYGTSDNTPRWWPHDHWTDLDYHPHDNATSHPLPPLTDHWHGGPYTA
ncbi:uronate dehydrogenase [Actinopolyspora alba]|uniref:Uronate dehydrogenase n=1 Tax=Actinopolyspora alba TaxID=673379 RepID=A0A1I1YT09_9ACTN|nr:NAD(P)-dependent oxidoreductase [Actinopolyspora alba]SFE22676.1 uronate dehydrogenase [Actinopolyspora alba]